MRGSVRMIMIAGRDTQLTSRQRFRARDEMYIGYWELLTEESRSMLCPFGVAKCLWREYRMKAFSLALFMSSIELISGSLEIE